MNEFTSIEANLLSSPGSFERRGEESLRGTERRLVWAPGRPTEPPPSAPEPREGLRGDTLCRLSAAKCRSSLRPPTPQDSSLLPPQSSPAQPASVTAALLASMMGLSLPLQPSPASGEAGGQFSPAIPQPLSLGRSPRWAATKRGHPGPFAGLAPFQSAPSFIPEEQEPRTCPSRRFCAEAKERWRAGRPRDGHGGCALSL